MKGRFFVKSSVILLLIISLLVPTAVFAGEERNYPEEVNGLPVIYVQTPANTEGLTAGQVILVLIDQNSKSLDDSFERLDFGNYLSLNPLPQNYSFIVVGGMTKDAYIKAHDEINVQIRTEVIRLGLPPATPVAGDSITEVGYHNSFACVKDTDPSWFQTISGIRVRWYAPAVGSFQSRYSALMVNGVTNYADQMVQCGQVFGTNGVGSNVWSDATIPNYEARYFTVPYIQSHLYEFTVALGSSEFGWWKGCEDKSVIPARFEYAPGTGISGDHLITNPGTGVFFENANTNPAWYLGFSNPIHAFTAKDFNGTWKDWNHEAITILDAHGNSCSNNGKIVGGLINGSTADWYLDQLLLGEYY